MTPRGTRAALGAAGLAVAAGVIAYVATSAFGRGSFAIVSGLATAATPLAWWVMGSVIVVRADGHRVGWLLTLAAVLGGAVLAGLPVASGDAAQLETPLAPWAVLIVSAAYGPAFVTVLLATMVLFPDGRLPGRAWRLPVLIPILMVATSTAALVLQPSPFGPGLPANPLGVEGLPQDALASLFVLGPLGIAALGIVGASALLARYLRAGPEVRAQLKWLLASVVPAVLITPLGFFDADQATSSAADLLSAVAILLVPVSVGIAITRHRLYEIDRIVSRGLAWAVLTTLLIALYAGAVLVLQAVLAGVTQGQTLAVAASTLLAFALFQPLRRRVHRAVDRRFDRARYDGERVVTAFNDRLRDEIDLETLTSEVRRVATETVVPLSATVWLRGAVRVPSQSRIS